MEETKGRLIEFNELVKENDEIYRNAARTVGLSDCCFWILYTLRDSAEELTQSELCTCLYQPKQTVNSALKKLENSGYLKLTAGKDHRSKYVCFTEKGAALAEKTVDRVIQIEAEALGGLTAREQETFIGLFRKYTGFLKRGMPDLAEKGREST